MSGNPGAAASRLERRVLYVAIVASFMVFLDGSVVNLALPAINRELGGGLVVQQWVVDAYLLTLGGLILVAGSLSDQFGRVRVLQWGLGGFTATSVLCGLAWSGESLILARGLQGVAGALLVPGSLALIVSVFKGAAQSLAIGRWSAWTSGAIVAAPLLGGLSVDLLTWRLIFFLNVVPAAAVWPFLRKLRELDLPHSPDSRIDVAGALLAVVGLGGPVYAFISRGSLGWGSPQVWLPLATGVLALTVFLVHEARTPAPMMPLRLFAVRNFAWGNIATTAIYGAVSLGFFVLGLFLQQVAGLGATAAGLAMLPSTLILLLLSSRIGALAGRFGPRWFMTGGPLLCAAGFLLLLGVDVPLDYPDMVLPGLLVFGLGLAITVAPLTAAILGAVAAEEAGIGSAINNAVARIAGLVAISFAGLITGSAVTTPGLHATVAVTAALLIVGALASAVGIRNGPRGEPDGAARGTAG
ncbi:MFS transporter [Arthrobacter sp. PAMC25564]|uniref:MFS transporter n=1 Tax=Arthrobacter sp. PAMC25564 TaxID=2565366 RepID=UPI0010A20505|nr:MFS transporter [Arthrobacter sp. PAMC25564]QCB96975.1 MFS transporter [Arthrobacter sp. PAMC25564]